MSVKKKLYMCFGIVVGLVAMLGLAAHLCLREAERYAAEQQRYQQVALFAQRTYTTLLQARRAEKDYFMREGDTRYLKAHAAHALQYTADVAKIRDALTASDQELSSKLVATESSFKSYLESFAAAVESFQRRGAQDTGMQGEFRAAAHSVERIALEQRDDHLTVLLLQARRAEKDYLLRADTKYAERVDAFIDQAQSYVRGAQALGARAEQLFALFEEYKLKFDAARKAQEDLDALKQDLHKTTEVAESGLQDFESLAGTHARMADEKSIAILQTTDFVLAGLFLVTIIVALFVAHVLSSQIEVAIGSLMAGTRSIASGDLTTDVKVATTDELGDLGGAFNLMVGSLKTMANNMTQATGSMNDMVKELQATVTEQGAAMQQQASAVSETVATVEELSRSSEQVSDVASRVLDAAGRSMETSRTGMDAIQQSVVGMNGVREQVENIARTILELSEKTQQIGTIISTVDDFAEQSSLLALNASIEAARAGENGKAFAVVAGEVKSLAEQSQKATERVRSILNEIQRVTHTAVMVTEEGSKRVERGVELVTGAGTIITSLAESIATSADSAKQIAAAARQQSNGIEQISVAMAGIEQFSRQNVEAIRQTETTSHTLASVAHQLKATAGQYRV